MRLAPILIPEHASRPTLCSAVTVWKRLQWLLKVFDRYFETAKFITFKLNNRMSFIYETSAYFIKQLCHYRANLERSAVVYKTDNNYYVPYLNCHIYRHHTTKVKSYMRLNHFNRFEIAAVLNNFQSPDFIAPTILRLSNS